MYSHEDLRSVPRTQVPYNPSTGEVEMGRSLGFTGYCPEEQHPRLTFGLYERWCVHVHTHILHEHLGCIVH